MIFADKEADNAVKEDSVSVYGFVHVSRRLKCQCGLLPPLLSVVFFELIPLAENRVDVKAFVDGAKVDQILGGQVCLGLVSGLGLTFIIDFPCKKVWS